MSNLCLFEQPGVKYADKSLGRSQEQWTGAEKLPKLIRTSV